MWGDYPKDYRTFDSDGQVVLPYSAGLHCGCLAYFDWVFTDGSGFASGCHVVSLRQCDEHPPSDLDPGEMYGLEQESEWIAGELLRRYQENCIPEKLRVPLDG